MELGNGPDEHVAGSGPQTAGRAGADVAATSKARHGGDPVEIRGLTKRFGRATVLNEVNLTLNPGEIHALVGQNGSGKSTVIKILSGVYEADGGQITVRGEVLPTPVRPADLRRHSLAFVHQDLGLVDDLSVVENVRVGQYQPGRVSRGISWDIERRHAMETLERLNSPIGTHRKVGSLAAAQRAVVAIARALQGLHPGTGCIVFDESTQSLPRETLPEFYAILRSIAQTGTGILIVSHRLDEVMTLADRVTVLRDGTLAAEGVPISHLTETGLSQLILGRELSTGHIGADFDLPTKDREVVFAATRLSGGSLRPLDIQVQAGEVLGITGAGDCGLHEIPDIIAGRVRSCSGQMRVGDRAFELPVMKPDSLREAGLAVIPHKRLVDGLAGELSAVENLTLPRITRRNRFFLSSGWQLNEFQTAVKSFGITPALPKSAASSYSGGNQQKLLLSKWFLDSPKVLVAHEPTQAVDVGARLDILRALRGVANQGDAVVLCSIEVQDLAVVCDRVIVLRTDRDPVELTHPMTSEELAEATYE